MKRLVLITAVGIAFAPAPAALATTDAECAAAWKSADTNADGALTDAEAGRYLAALRVAQKPAADGRLTQAAFMEHCKAGVFRVSNIEPGAPLAGANSFTEAQATDRILSAGFSKITGLAKDANGVWRGTASDGTKNLNVAVDYKGNVVAK